MTTITATYPSLVVNCRIFHWSLHLSVFRYYAQIYSVTILVLVAKKKICFNAETPTTSLFLKGHLWQSHCSPSEAAFNPAKTSSPTSMNFQLFYNLLWNKVSEAFYLCVYLRFPTCYILKLWLRGSLTIEAKQVYII